MVSDTPPAFGFRSGREGLNASAVKEDGSAATQAGSHPQQVNVNLSISTDANPSGTNVIPNGTLDNVKVDLPAGMVVDPSTTDKCTEVQLVALACPDSSQVGVVSVPLQTGAPASTRLYNLEAPPGYAASFGFKIADVPVHVFGGVRPGDYRVTSLSPDALSILTIFAARVQLWGSPTDVSHDGIRGACGGTVTADAGKLCPVTRGNKPLISMPTSCGSSMQIDAHVSFWDEPDVFHDRTAEFTDSNGNTTPVTGCDQLQFDPTLAARPTTNVADSPTGLEASLRVPQTDQLGAKATAHLRKAVVTLPEGLALNPSSANGLDGCDSGQIGVDPETGVADGEPVRCPDASRIGTVEVTTPLLDHDLPGSVFVATPFDNPFDSLLAIYVVVDDPATGILAKLAGHVVADPETGRLTTTFDDNPQIPFSEFKLHFFGGAAAPLRTPAVCGSYETTSSLTPWSAPASGPPATPSDSWAITRSPSGPCAFDAGALPNSPRFDAGSVSPIAGKHTPFVLDLKRDDATQQFSAVDVTPPPGLLAKLAGTTECSDAALATAADKSGKEESAAPSCPDSSRVGSVEVSAGAGPAPYYTTGTAYLAGPYKGAPMSMAIVTPATAGPYDLGTVVVRTALYVDPVTIKISAVSDPIPTILQGVPLDVRSARISLDRPEFTLNGTSCEPSSVNGLLTTTIGHTADLFSRFQLGECARLDFEPRLSLRLKGKTRRGGFPAVRSVYVARAGDANLENLVLRLPRSEFIEQAHFRTICTRMQYAAGDGNGANCPAGSVYGHVRAFTPLLDQPLEGPVFLRSSSHELPDIVFALRGKIDADVAVRVDSVNGGLRASLEDAPDAPISKVVLNMQGGNKGLIVNSRDICARTYKATAKFDGQNGKVHDFKTKLKADCKGKGKKGKAKGRRR